jgi:hypothetical protein
MRPALKPRTHTATGDITDGEMWYLMGGADAPGITPAEWDRLGFSEWFREGRPSIRDLWRIYQSDVLDAWRAEVPGQRPPLWWTHSAPGPLRRRVGGTGTLLADCLAAYAPSPPRYGVPTGWLTADLAAYYRQEDPAFRWPAVGLADPPRFESEATYLDRNGLLKADERRRLPADAFDPEPITDLFEF